MKSKFELIEEYYKKEQMNLTKDLKKSFLKKIKKEGDNFFILNDFKKNKGTLYDYDYKIYKNNKESGLKDLEFKIPFLQGEFFIAFDNFGDQLSKIEYLISGKIVSLYWYLFESVYEDLNNYIDKKYPNIIVNEEVKAFGKENIVNESKNKILEYYRDINNLRKIFLKFYPIELFGDRTFRKITNDKFDIDTFIIGGNKASKEIKLSHFIKDFKKKEEPFEIILKRKEKLVKKIIKKLKI